MEAGPRTVLRLHRVAGEESERMSKGQAERMRTRARLYAPARIAKILTVLRHGLGDVKKRGRQIGIDSPCQAIGSRAEC